MFEGLDAIVASSEAAAAAIRDRFSRRAARGRLSRHRHDPVQHRRRARRAADGLLPRPPSRSPAKRVEMVARAHALVRERIPEARLVLAILPGPSAAGLDPRGAGVEIRPIRSDEELEACYREAWVSVLASREEPFGLVLVESLACGTPVIGTRSGGITEIIGPDAEVGGLFDGGAEELAEQLAARLQRAPRAGGRRALPPPRRAVLGSSLCRRLRGALRAASPQHSARALRTPPVASSALQVCTIIAKNYLALRPGAGATPSVQHIPTGPARCS